MYKYTFILSSQPKYSNVRTVIELQIAKILKVVSQQRKPPGSFYYYYYPFLKNMGLEKLPKE